VYQVFYSYILTEKQLEENSFPSWMTTVNNIDGKSKGRLACIPNFKNTSVTKSSLSDKPKQDDSKTDIKDDVDKFIMKSCKRCNKTFQITSKSFLYSPSNSECVFHWGKLRSMRFNKSIEQKYSCCSGDLNSGGCETGKHVYDGDYDGNSEGKNILGYIETIKNSISDDTKSKSSSNIFALDCEMCYTTKGLELARVSIVDINLKEVYESIVKPECQVLDYNTRWSGLTEESLRNCNKNINQVQNELLKFLNRDSILIGHSLDSDFKALKLIHKTVIDTSCVFPHKMGPPIKRALRNLMSEYLQKTIQEDGKNYILSI
jgi:RNA exonuclease 1